MPLEFTSLQSAVGDDPYSRCLLALRSNRAANWFVGVSIGTECKLAGSSVWFTQFASDPLASSRNGLIRILTDTVRMNALPVPGWDKQTRYRDERLIVTALLAKGGVKSNAYSRRSKLLCAFQPGPSSWFKIEFSVDDTFKRCKRRRSAVLRFFGSFCTEKSEPLRCDCSRYGKSLFVRRSDAIRLIASSSLKPVAFNLITSTRKFKSSPFVHVAAFQFVREHCHAR